MQDFGRISTKNNLSLRNTYKRYFIWGSKEKPGFKNNLPKNPKKISYALKIKLEKASYKRITKIILIVCIFLSVITLVGYFVKNL